MQVRLGIAIGRRAARILVLRRSKRSLEIALDREVARPVGASPAHMLGLLLGGLSALERNLPVSLSLSSGDFACDDVWPAPAGMRSREAASVAPVLLESRCAGETLEGLSRDIHSSRGHLAASAIATGDLEALREAARAQGAVLRSVTSIPASIAHVFPSAARIALVWAGQKVEIERSKEFLRWRSVPEDRIRGEMGVPGLSIQGLVLAPGQVAAAAAALADPEGIPDALRGAPDAPKTLGAKVRRPLRALALAASFLLVALGLAVRARAQRALCELEKARAVEAQLWKLHFQDRPYVKGDLLRLSKEKLQSSGIGAGEGALPSAFLSFMELGRQLPPVEELGMTLESLDLSPEGGRLSATVAAVPADTLRNAALLEAKLGDSKTLAARGDFETHGPDVQVRLKLDYRNR